MTGRQSLQKTLFLQSDALGDLDLMFGHRAVI
jgi:hypothetical protein